MVDVETDTDEAEADPEVEVEARPSRNVRSISGHTCTHDPKTHTHTNLFQCGHEEAHAHAQIVHKVITKVNKKAPYCQDQRNLQIITQTQFPIVLQVGQIIYR